MRKTKIFYPINVCLAKKRTRANRMILGKIIFNDLCDIFRLIYLCCSITKNSLNSVYAKYLRVSSSLLNVLLHTTLHNTRIIMMPI